MLCLNANADHITGGEMSYRLMQINGTLYTYRVSLKLYKRCGSTRTFNNPTAISVFHRGDGRRNTDWTVALAREETIEITDPDPCISNPPRVCYDIAYYEFDLTLPATEDGYVISSQVNFRINNLVNLVPGYSFVGALYTSEIPGVIDNPNGAINNSAKFTGSDLVVICAEAPFTYSFAATDADKDELRYSLCDAYNSGLGSSPFGIEPTQQPPYLSLPYTAPYTGKQPLGAQVTINPTTGLVSGIAPKAGSYVLNVCVDEIRGGKVLATQRKDIQINVANCGLTTASLLPEYQVCGSSSRLSVSNLSTSTLIKSYRWQISTLSGVPLYNTANPVLDYDFADTGLFRLKLVINPNQPCSDSTLSLVRVYPGLKAGYKVSSLCNTRPTQFTDQSSSAYGIVNSWSWFFDEPLVTDDSSVRQNPLYTFNTAGTKNVQFIVGDTKGCRDTLSRAELISQNPSLQFAFRDTLICRGDTVALVSNASGNIQWSPNQFLTLESGGQTRVYPPVTTTYYASLEDEGCTNRDSVRVNVVDSVNLAAMRDTTICLGDGVPLRLQTNALYFTWTPATGLNSISSRAPIATPLVKTKYQVVAGIGSCNAIASIVITPVPYPTAFAGKDTTICFGEEAILFGSSNGSRFQWMPGQNLYNSTSLVTMATPAATTTFQLQTFDNKGCPKPGIDSVLVTVLPPIMPGITSDTSVVVGQPLQLLASGGTRYAWSPPQNLNNAFINNPIATFTQPANEIIYRVNISNEDGCRDAASLRIKVFANGPTVYVPTGFTPNGDGKNDELRPILAGIRQLLYFKIFNRLGQPVFTTSAAGKGWDGRLNGQPQASAAFVWMVRAVDYTGRVLDQKGTTVLVR